MTLDMMALERWFGRKGFPRGVFSVDSFLAWSNGYFMVAETRPPRPIRGLKGITNVAQARWWVEAISMARLPVPSENERELWRLPWRRRCRCVASISGNGYDSRYVSASLRFVGESPFWGMVPLGSSPRGGEYTPPARRMSALVLRTANRAAVIAPLSINNPSAETFVWGGPL